MLKKVEFRILTIILNFYLQFIQLKCFSQWCEWNKFLFIQQLFRFLYQKWISFSWKTCRWLLSLHLNLNWFLKVWEWNQQSQCEMKSKIQLSIAKLCMIHVLQFDNVDIWDSEWYTASNIKKNVKYINQQQYYCRLDENQHDNNHHVSFWRSFFLES